MEDFFLKISGISIITQKYPISKYPKFTHKCLESRKQKVAGSEKFQVLKVTNESCLTGWAGLGDGGEQDHHLWVSK